jgi:hypothetical protein
MLIIAADNLSIAVAGDNNAHVMVRFVALRSEE